MTEEQLETDGGPVSSRSESTMPPRSKSGTDTANSSQAGTAEKTAEKHTKKPSVIVDRTAEYAGKTFVFVGVPMPPGSEFAEKSLAPTSKSSTDTANSSEAGTAEKKDEKPTTKPPGEIVDMTSEYEGTDFIIIRVLIPPGSRFFERKKKE